MSIVIWFCSYRFIIYITNKTIWISFEILKKSSLGVCNAICQLKQVTDWYCIRNLKFDIEINLQNNLTPKGLEIKINSNNYKIASGKPIKTKKIITKTRSCKRKLMQKLFQDSEEFIRKFSYQVALEIKYLQN